MPFNLYGHLIKALEFLYFRSNVPSHDVLGQLGRYDHPWVKKKIKTEKQTNKHASVIFFLAKNTKFHVFADRSFETSTVGFSETPNLMM